MLQIAFKKKKISTRKAGPGGTERRRERGRIALNGKEGTGGRILSGDL